MSSKSPLALIDEECCGSLGSNEDLHSPGNLCDTYSETTLQDQEISDSEATPSLQLQAFGSQSTDSNPAFTESLLALTDEAMGLAKKLYALADDKYAAQDDMEISQIVHARSSFEAGASHSTEADMRPNAKTALAKRQLKMLEGRLEIAKAQEKLAEDRLKVAKSQVHVAEDRVIWALEQLDSAKRR